jgi:hypothetical protein
MTALDVPLAEAASSLLDDIGGVHFPLQAPAQLDPREQEQVVAVAVHPKTHPRSGIWGFDFQGIHHAHGATFHVAWDNMVSVHRFSGR